MLVAELTGAVGAIEIDVALEIPRGDCLALAGPSGSGKTTILRMLAGLVEPAGGRITCGDRVWFDPQTGANLQPEQRRCGLVFQHYALFGHLTALNNVAYGLSGLPRTERKTRALELLDRFGVAALAESRPSELSGGERQRVALARTLATRPEVLLLDEPLSALDVRSRMSAGSELRAALADFGVPTVLVTHDYMEAALLGDRISVIDDGKIIQSGAAGEISARPTTPFVADFTGANVLRGRAGRRERDLTSVAIDGGGSAVITEPATGDVAIGVHPWDITLGPSSSPATGSAQNRLAVEIISVVPIGNRVRVGLAAPQPLIAEVTAAAVEQLELRPGNHVEASWKATATRLLDVHSTDVE